MRFSFKSFVSFNCHMQRSVSHTRNTQTQAADGQRSIGLPADSNCSKSAGWQMLLPAGIEQQLEFIQQFWEMQRTWSLSCRTVHEPSPSTSHVLSLSSVLTLIRMLSSLPSSRE